jgi:hypothetical protein
MPMYLKWVLLFLQAQFERHKQNAVLRRHFTSYKEEVSNYPQEQMAV